MRAKDFIFENTIQRYATGGVVPFNPIARSKARDAYNTVKSINQSNTAQDRIEKILKDGGTNNKIVVLDKEGKRYTFKEYDKETGQIKVSSHSKNFTINIDNIQFDRKERSISSTIKYWIFVASDLTPDEPTNIKRTYKSKKPTYDMPNRLW